MCVIMYFFEWSLMVILIFDICSRNGGFICPGTSEKYSDSCARYGKEATKALFDFTVAGTDIVKDFMEVCFSSQLYRILERLISNISKIPMMM
jgi:hypothetical protein